MTLTSEDRKYRIGSDGASASDKQLDIEIEVENYQHHPEKDNSSNNQDMRQTLIQNRERKRHSFLKRFLFTLLLLGLVPNSAVHGLALNINPPGSSNRNELPSPVSPESATALHQFYFRNTTNTKPSSSSSTFSGPVVISSSSDNSNSQTDAEPKSNLSISNSNSGNVSAFSDINSAENAILHEPYENDAKKGQQLYNSPSVGSGQGSTKENETSLASPKPVCEKNGTSGYQHTVEDILRQIFGADGLDEDETDEDEDDEEFMNEYYRDRDDRYEFERSTGTSSSVFNRTSAVHHARQARDIDSRRGPLQVDDDESAQSTDEEEDTPPQPPPKPKKPAAPAQNNKNRMNPPKQQVQQPNRKKQQQKQQNRKPQKQKTPVNPAEKRAEMLTKYNAYVDAVFSRMNVLIKKKRMDPLRVNLYAGPSKPGGAGGGGAGNGSGSDNGVAKNNGKRKGALGKNKNKRKNSRIDDDSASDDHDEFRPSEEHEEDDDESSGASSADEERGFRSDDSPAVHDIQLDSNVFGRSIRSLLANISQYSHAVLSNPSPSSEMERYDDEDDNSGSHGELDTVEEGRGNVNSKAPGKNKNKNPKNRNGGVQNKNNTTAKFVGKNRNKHKFNKNKNKNKSAPRPTRGILHGLSSLRRDGNVQVVKDGPKARIVRAKFLLGPVALEILPKKGKPNRGGQGRESSDNNLNASTGRQDPSPAGNAQGDTSLSADPDTGSSNGASPGATDGASTTPAATATAPQLRGILEIRLAPNRPTRIRKLRVFPPGNVQVDGDKATANSGGGASSKTGSGYRKVTPQATARLRQTALQVVRQVDRRLRPAEDGSVRKRPVHRMTEEE